jgi:uncharacterized membrane protein HdeD (DUF308 family)
MAGWVRGLEILFGLVSLVAGVWVLAYPGLAVLTLIALLAVGLFFMGWRDVLIGAMASALPGWVRAVDILLGVSAFILSAVAIAEPGFAVLTLVLILYVALFVSGVHRIALGAAGKPFSKSLRAASIIAGVLSIALSLVFLSYPGLAVATLILILSIGLILIGLEAIMAGIVGRVVEKTIARQLKM